MRAALTKAGWGNYTLFLTDDGLLIGYLETPDYQAALEAMAKTEVNERWQAEMSEFFVTDGPPDEGVGQPGLDAGSGVAAGQAAEAEGDAGGPVGGD